MTDTTQVGRSTDEELVARARDGEVRAMNELVSRHHGSAYRTALTILKDEDGAADVAQDTFVKAFRGLAGFRGDASFRTWLLTIAANEARGVLRKRARWKEESLEATGPVPSRDTSPVDRIVREEEEAGIRRLLEILPEKQRRAVSLRIFEGLSFREVGEIIGSSEGAARVNYHHGIRRIREELG